MGIAEEEEEEEEQVLRYQNFLIPPRPVACRQPTTVDASGHRPLELEDMMAYTTLLMLGKLPQRKCP